MVKLTRDSILNAVDLKTEVVQVPEWGGEVLIKELSGTERDAFEGATYEMDEKKKFKNIRARLVQKCAVDEDGKLLFEVTDVETLGSKSGAALDRLYSVAARLSGMTKTDVEQLEKN